MLNVISAMSTIPTQPLSFDASLGPVVLLALVAVGAIAFADRARAFFATRRPGRSGLRLVHSN